jgi:hypothetical protein
MESSGLGSTTLIAGREMTRALEVLDRLPERLHELLGHAGEPRDTVDGRCVRALDDPYTVPYLRPHHPSTKAHPAKVAADDRA